MKSMRSHLMDTEVDHYMVLGLPSGEEGTNLTQTEISKAYRAKALDLHPDKRPDDPNADANFKRLKSSYEILKDQNARDLFDASLRAKREEQHHQSNLHLWEEQYYHFIYQSSLHHGSDLQARARERRSPYREELFGDLEEILRGVQQQHHGNWQLDANPERCSLKPKRCCSISKQEDEERLRGECHLKLPLVFLFLFASCSMVGMYGVRLL